jgi:hypothetical protein
VTENARFGFISSVRQAEPIAVLASLTLAIAVFTFNQADFGKIYQYSSTASVLFIFSFILAIIASLIKESESPKELETMLLKLVNPGVYLFLAVGLVHLLLIAVEFATRDLHIVNFIFGYVFLFFAMVNVLLYGLMQKPRMNLFALNRRWFLYLYKISFGVAIASAVIGTLIFLYQGFSSTVVLAEVPKIWLLLFSTGHFILLMLISSVVGPKK